MNALASKIDLCSGRWWLVCPVLAVTAILANIPLFVFNSLFCSQDLTAYWMWTESFTNALMEGVWQPRWDAKGVEGLGSTAFLIVSPAFFYMAGLIRFFGADVWLAMRLVVWLALFILGVSVWAGLIRYVSPRWAFLGALCFQFNPFLFHVVNLHNLFPFFFAVVPLSWFLFSTLRPQQTLSLRVSFSLAALILTHPLAAFCALLSMPFVWLAQILNREPNAFRKTIMWGLSCGLGVLLAAYHLFPALTTTDLTSLGGGGEPFHIDFRTSFIMPLVTMFMHGQRWAGVQWGLGGVAVLSLAVIGGILFRDRGILPQKKVLLSALFAAGLAGVFWASEWSYAFWALIPPMRMVEWPYRFLIVILPITIVGLVYAGAASRTPLMRWLAIAVLGLYPILTIGLQVKNIPIWQQPIAEQLPVKHYGVMAGVEDGWRQYMAEGAFDAECERLQVAILDSSESSHRYEWTLESDRPIRLRLPVFSFPAWQLKVNGSEQDYTKDEETQLISFQLPSGVSHVELYYSRLWQDQVGWALSGLALLVASCIMVHRMIKRRHSR